MMKRLLLYINGHLFCHRILTPTYSGLYVYNIVVQ